MGFWAFRVLQLIWASWPSVRCSFIWAFWTFRALLFIWASWPFGRAAMAFNYPIHPPVRLKLSSTPFCTVVITQHTLLYGWIYPIRPPVWLNLPNTPSCMVEITQHALKGQKLLAQGIALGIKAISDAPCKGKSFKIHLIKKWKSSAICKAFALTGRAALAQTKTQGAALG